MDTPETLQAELQGWEGIDPPMKLAEVQASTGYQAMRPAARVQAINQNQRNWANWLREKAPDYGGAYGDMVRGLEDDYGKARRTEVEDGLAEDVATGALSEDAAKKYLKGGTEALVDEGEASGYVAQRYGGDVDLAGPWLTTKATITGGDGKPAGFAYIRHKPGLSGDALTAGLPPAEDYPSGKDVQWSGEPGSDRVEVSWTLNGKDGQMEGTEDVETGPVIARARKADNLRFLYPSTIPADLEELADLPGKVGSQAFPGVAAVREVGQRLRERPEVANRMGQGFWQGLGGQIAKGFLNLGGAAVHGPGALMGDKDALKRWQEGREDIEGDIEGQSRLGFRGGFWDKVGTGISEELLPMALSMGSSALAGVARKAVTSAAGRTFLSRMAAMELETAAKQGAAGMSREAMAQALAAELTGEGAGTTLRQGLATSVSRGLLGKWLGTAEIEGPLAKQLADRVTNAVAFLPSSMRSGLDNMATTLSEAEAARAAGDEAKAQKLEDNVILNGWAGTMIETLSENMWLNEMMVTRAGRPLSKVANEVLERRLGAGRMAVMADRMKRGMLEALKQGNEEGVEEIVAGTGGRAWMNKFAEQNQDLLQDVPAEYTTGAVLGAAMSAAKALAHDGKPQMLQELLTRGLNGDSQAAEAWTRVQEKAAARREAGTEPPPVAATPAPPGEAPPSTPREGAREPSRLERLAGTVPGDNAPLLPASEEPVDNELVPAPPPEGTETEDATLEEEGTTGPEDALFPMPGSDTGVPGTVAQAPVPDSAETVAEQARLALDPGSTRAAVLLTPGTPDPGTVEGLQTVKPPHGRVLYNPRKVSVTRVMQAGEGEVFDGTLLGMSGEAPGPGNSVVTVSTPDARNVQAEVVSSTAEVPAVIEAAEAAVPGGTVEIKTPSQVAEERKENIIDAEERVAPGEENGHIETSVSPEEVPGTPGNAVDTAGQPDPAKRPASGRRTFIWKDADARRFGEHPLVQLIRNAGGMLSMQGAMRRAARRAGSDKTARKSAEKSARAQYEDFDETVRRQKHYRSQIFTTLENAMTADEMAAEAHRQGLIPDSQPSTLAAAVNAALEGDKRRTGQPATMEEYQVQQAMDQEAKDRGLTPAEMVRQPAKDAKFERDTQKPKGDAKALPVEELTVGTTLRVKGEMFRVDKVEADEDGNVERVRLKDGPEYGVLWVAPGEVHFVQALRIKRAGKARIDDDTPFSRGGQGLLPGVPVKAGEDALRMLAQNAPELAAGVRLVRTVADLRGGDYTPGELAYLGNGRTEAFYDTATGETVVILDQVHRREGETPIGAVARVIAHERIGHAGLAVLRQGDPMFARQWAALTEEIPAEELAALLPDYPHLAEQPDKLAEEWFARQAERVPVAKPGSLIGRMWTAIKAAVARLWRGFVTPKGMTLEQRVGELVARSRAALEGGRAGREARMQSLGDRLAAGMPLVAENATILPPRMRPLEQSITAYHGTPHEVDAFTTEKIGTGEGQQVYGWGLYFAEKRATAQWYYNGLNEKRNPNEPRSPAYQARVDEMRARVKSYLEGSAVPQGWRDSTARWISANSGKANALEKMRGNLAADPQGFSYLVKEIEYVESVPDEVGELPPVEHVPTGAIYTVELRPDEDELLDWDRALEDQPAPVMAKLETLRAALPEGWVSFLEEMDVDMDLLDGKRFYKLLARWSTESPLPGDVSEGGDEKREASEFLARNGIPGIRYLDGGSRNKGDGTRNYVIFDGADIRITERDGQPVTVARLMESRAPGNPYEARDLPDWLQRRMGIAGRVKAYTVKNQAARAILTGSPLPKALAEIVSETEDQTGALKQRAAQVTNDLQAAMKAHAKSTGVPLLQVSDRVNTALEDPAALAVMTDPVLQQRTREARNFLDALSDEVAAITGGTLGQTILNNKGHWMRRSYAAFDKAAGWNYDALEKAAAKGKTLAGQPAARILANARGYLQAANPNLTPGGIEAMMRELTDRESWTNYLAGGGKVSKETGSLMARRTIPIEIRLLMGEITNPLARLAQSAGFQAQFIARHQQQERMRDLGLSMGLFSTTKTGRYTEEVGGKDNQRWNGFNVTNPQGKVVPVYTTPELLGALQAAPGVGEPKDLSNAVLAAYKALGGWAKMNKVALNPDSVAVNLLGNLTGLMMTGDMLTIRGLRAMGKARGLLKSGEAKNGEAVNAAAEILQDQKRAMLARLAGAGVTESYDLKEIQAGLDSRLIQFIEADGGWNRTVGAVRGAVLGQSFGRVAGPVGRVVGAVAGAAGGTVAGSERITKGLNWIAEWTLGKADRWGKVTSFLANYETHLAAGMGAQAAFDLATEKTLNTMPNYSALPSWAREMSKLGLMGSFIAFQHEVYRNYYHNARYAFQELRSGNGVMMRRGAARLLGAAGLTAMAGWGLSGLVQCLFGGGTDDEKMEAYPRALAAPWEKYSRLAFTKLDEDGASFYNTSYLIPQATLFTLWKAGARGSEEGFTGALKAVAEQLWDQFGEGSVHADPVLAAMTNSRPTGGPISTRDGAQGFLERLDYVLRNTLEPGAADKVDRIVRAVQERPRGERSFTLGEEGLRLLGVRQATYAHDSRIKGRLWEFEGKYDGAMTEAKRAYRENAGGGGRERALAAANERIAQIRREFSAWEAQIETLGLTRLARHVKKDMQFRKKFNDLKLTDEGVKTVK